LIEDRPDASAVVIACFSDPGWEAGRKATKVPVIGIQRASVLSALGVASSFGVIALSDAAIPRHMVKYDQIGVRSKLAGEIGLGGVSALAAGRDDIVYEETRQAGERLVKMGAEAIVLGCAGFSPRQNQLQHALGLPVIDPVRAGIGMALGQSAL
jgi:Asp/Glu/hydantoin racemase